MKVADDMLEQLIGAEKATAKPKKAKTVLPVVPPKSSSAMGALGPRGMRTEKVASKPNGVAAVPAQKDRRSSAPHSEVDQEIDDFLMEEELLRRVATVGPPKKSQAPSEKRAPSKPQPVQINNKKPPETSKAPIKTSKDKVVDSAIENLLSGVEDELLFGRKKTIEDDDYLDDEFDLENSDDLRKLIGDSPLKK